MGYVRDIWGYMSYGLGYIGIIYIYICVCIGCRV